MMCRTNNDLVNQQYKLLTADLSQVCNGRSMVDEFASSSLLATWSDGNNEDQAVVRDKKRLSLLDACTSISKDVSKLDASNASSITEGSTVDSSDPAVSQRRPAGTSVLDQHNRRPCESSEIASKLDESIASSRTEDKLDESNASSRAEDSITDCRDPAVSQHRPARTSFPNQNNRRHSEPSVVASQMDTSNTSLITKKALSRAGNTIRRRSQPLHKCPSLNQALSSAMRPPKYSSANTSGFDSSANKPPRMMRRSTVVPSMSSSFSSPSSSHRTSADRWIASGVVFSTSVEVYLFRAGS
uniref:Uncharacterized protein n=1 Tax=Skeletonema marinoi TaxID=267567 RepID=A0A7S2Q1S1_9STRA